MAATLKNGTALAAWLLAVHPQIFAAIAHQARARKTLGDCNCSHGLGDDYSTYDMEGNLVDTGGFDAAPISMPDIQLVAIDPDTFTTPVIDIPPITTDVTSSASDLTDQSGNTSSIFSTVASGIGNALSSVGSYLTSAQGLNALVGLGTQYLKATTAQSNAQTQSAILQQQALRVASGQAPAAVSYQVNPYTGQLTPVVATTTGGTVPYSYPGVSSALAPSSLGPFISEYGLYIGAGLLLLLILRR